MPMIPRQGEVWRTDLGIADKVRPTVVILDENVPVDRSLVVYVPVTSQIRGGPLEVALGHLGFLSPESVANVQAIGAVPRNRFERRLGTLHPADLARIKQALRLAFGL